MEKNGETVQVDYTVENIGCDKITIQLEFPDPSEISDEDQLVISINEPTAFVSEDGNGILDPLSLQQND